MYPNRNGQFNHPRDPKFSPRPQLTLSRSMFPSYDSYMDAERLVLGIVEGKIGEPKREKDGSVNYGEILDVVDAENIDLKYMGYEHIVEIFLRHSPSVFALDGDNLVSTRPVGAGNNMEPPELLYFGTVFGVAAQAYGKGLQSKRHPYVILQTSLDAATASAKIFSQNTNDKAVVIVVQAKQAYAKGVKFLQGNREGQVMTEYISRGFLSFDPRILVEIDSALGATRM